MPKEIPQIAAVAAPGVEYTPSAIEPAAKELIEEVDIDLAELRSELG
jgi:hypothetical protein